MAAIQRHIVSGILLILVLALSVSAQESGERLYEYEFRGESLVEVLDYIALDTNIDLVYDPQFVNGIYVYQRIRQHSIPDLLSQLLSEYGLDYITLSSGTIVVISSSRDLPAYGEISGKIVDAVTGDPLPGATILIADAGGGTMSNRMGNFKIPNVITGKHQIIISYIGYASEYRTIEIEPDRQAHQNIELNPDRLSISPLVVKAHRPLLPSNQSRHSLENDSDFSTPGATHSPIRNLSLVSGIQHGLPLKDIHLQGSHQGEHRITYDGIPIYNPYSFGQLFSSFSPLAVGNVTINKAGYDVRDGSQLAGLIQLTNDLPYTENQNFIGRLDPLSINLRGDGSIPIGGDKSIQAMVALRSSYWDVIENPRMSQLLKSWDVIDPLIADQYLDDEWNPLDYNPFSHGSDIKFYDIHSALRYRIDNYSELNASLYIAENSIQTRLTQLNPNEDENERFLFSSDTHEWSNIAAQVSWNMSISPRWDLDLQSAYSANTFKHQNIFGFMSMNPFLSDNLYRTLSSSTGMEDSSFRIPIDIDGNQIQHFITKADAVTYLNPNYTLYTGLQVERVFSEVDISDAAFLSTNSSQTSTFTGGYVHANHQLNYNWRLTYGTRLTFISSANSVFPEPRFSIQYDKPDASIGYWSVRLAGGLYRQFINEFRITNTGATTVVPDVTMWSHADESAIPKSYQITGSLLIEPVSESSISIDSYYKWQPVTNITSYRNLISGTEFDRSDIRAFAGTTKSEIFGAGVRFIQTFKDWNLRASAGYDYTYNQIDFSDQFGKKMMSPWNEPHRAQFRLLYRISPSVSALTVWQGVWGRAWAYRQSYYNFIQPIGGDQLTGLNLNSPDNDELPPFQQIDLTVIYQPKLKSADLEFRLELINLLNRRNSIEKYLLPIPGDNETTLFEVRERLLPGFYPSVSLQIKL